MRPSPSAKFLTDAKGYKNKMISLLRVMPPLKVVFENHPPAKLSTMRGASRQCCSSAALNAALLRGLD
jgi:hypothetical protein